MKVGVKRWGQQALLTGVVLDLDWDWELDGDWDWDKEVGVDTVMVRTVCVRIFQVVSTVDLFVLGGRGQD